MKKYTKEEVQKATLDYFNGDELAANVFFKYCLQDKEGNYLELTPDDMHKRLAKEFARIEKKYPNPLTEQQIYEYLKDFKYVCVTKDTWILTSEGAKKVKDLINKNFISVVDGKLYRSSLEGFYKTGHMTVYELTTKQGYKLKATENHPILVHESIDWWRKNRKTKWVPVKDLQYGDKVVVHNHRGNFWSGKGNFNEGWMLGSLIGDGTFGKNAELIFQGEEFEEQSKIALEILNKNLNNKVDRILGHKNESKHVFALKDLTRLAKEYGIIKDSKEITDKIEKASSEFTKGFISGYFDADGSVNCKGKSFDIRLNSSNLHNLESVQRMLLRLGIVSRIYKNRKKEGKRKFTNRKKLSYCKANHDLVVSRDNVLLFANMINFTVCKYKKDKLENFIASNHKFRKERWFAEIESIKEVGKEDVYDCTIPQISAFDANGLYVHNCPQGSPMSGIGNNFQNVSLSNCFVIESPNDNMSKIFNAGRDLANLSKRRGGVGLDLSELRPDGATVNNSAKTSSGAWSFADFYSNIGRMVGQNGRRAAIMLTMDIKHPDVEKFIIMKHDLKKVTGANVSVKIRDDFMRAVEEDKKYTLQWPIDSKNPKITKVVEAKDIWNLIADSATKTAEPGVLFWDTMLDYLPAQCYANEGFRHCSTNPCSELILSANDSCRLITNNLKHLVKNPFTKNAEFDFNKWRKIVRISMRLSDDLIDLELEKLEKLIELADTEDEKNLFKKMHKSCANGRRTGLGTHGLADTLARLCLSYDSDKSLQIIDKIYNTLKEEAYKCSVLLAQERGAFTVFDWQKEKDNKFINSLSKKLQNDIKKYGRRNISILTNAPTGSVSILSQTSSGLEPVFKNSYTRRKKLNHNETDIKADFIDDLGDRWVEFEVFHHNVREWMEKNPNKELPNFFVESDSINWKKRVEIQSIMTSHIDHSISSTINLPKDTSSKVVADLYMNAWKKGCKGLTVYVDGSRSGVLVNKKEQNNNEFKYVDAIKRPQELQCDIHNTSIKGEKWVIFVGLMNNKPYEIFGGLSNNIEIPPKYKTGTIVKVSNRKHTPNRYDLKVNGLVIKDLISQFNNPTYQVHTRMVSLALRHGTKPSFLIEQLLKDSDNDLTSFSKVLARVLKKYVEDGTKVMSGDKTCEQCKEESLIYQDGCVLCKSCGWSRCS